MELGLRVGLLGGNPSFGNATWEFRGVGNVELGLSEGMLRGNPRMARGYGTPRGRRVDLSPVHRDSNPRMARGFGAPRGRRVEKVP